MLRWILICLLLGLSAVAADASVSGDGEARALTRQAQRTADDVGAVGAGEERARIDRALDAIARFRARIEAGLAQASPQRLQELDRAEAALLDVPVRIEDGDAPAALATISGTVTAQVGGAPLQNVQVRATEFSFQSNVSGIDFSEPSGFIRARILFLICFTRKDFISRNTNPHRRSKSQSFLQAESCFIRICNPGNYYLVFQAFQVFCIERAT